MKKNKKVVKKRGQSEIHYKKGDQWAPSKGWLPNSHTAEPKKNWGPKKGNGKRFESTTTVHDHLTGATERE